MAAPVIIPSTIHTLADLLDRLGGVPLERIRWRPYPGTATEADVLAAVEADDKHLCELVDGVLVEKPMGQYEARVAFVLDHLIEDFLEVNDLGIVYGPDATLRVLPQLVRLPDVSFVSWDRLP